MISLEKDNLVICVRAATRDSHELQLHPLIFLFSGCNYAPLRFHSSNRNVPVLITLTISRQYVKFLRGNKKRGGNWLIKNYFATWKLIRVHNYYYHFPTCWNGSFTLKSGKGICDKFFNEYKRQTALVHPG